jgi:hypothetical protein
MTNLSIYFLKKKGFPDNYPDNGLEKRLSGLASVVHAGAQTVCEGKG